MSAGKKAGMDMTQGTIWNKILLFALPLAASSMLQQLFNSVDTAVVGRFASSEALAAVGSNGSLISLMINLFIGISLGANVVIAKYIGQKSEENVQAAVHTAIVVALISGVFVMIFGQLIAKPVLTLMGTPDDVIDLAVQYLRIYLLGMPFIMLYDFGSSILRSIGDSKRPLYSLIAAGIINTGLNLLLVIVFQMSVAGVAIATVISNLTSASIVMYILMHETSVIRIDRKQLKIVPKELKKILVIGIPAGLQGMMFSIANVCIQSAINSFGSDAIAGSAAALNYEFFAYFVVNAFAQATVTFTSQNFGAGEPKRCRKIFHTSMVLSLVCCGLLSLVFVVWRNFFLQIYTTDPAVLLYAKQRIVIATTLECLTSVYEISAGAMRGLAQSGPLPHREAVFTMPVTKPCFGVAYREEPLAEGDIKRELLLDMLGDLVVGGLTKLYRRLYDEALVNPEFSGDFIAVRGACAVAFTGESDTPREVVDLLQAEIERMRRDGVDPEVFMLVKNQMYGELLGDVEAVDDAAEEAAAACLKGRTLADEIAALAELTVDDANALLRTALREENRAYVQIDPAEA